MDCDGPQERITMPLRALRRLQGTKLTSDLGGMYASKTHPLCLVQGFENGNTVSKDRGMVYRYYLKGERHIDGYMFFFC